MPRVDRNAPAGMPGVGTQSDDNSVATVPVGETTLSDVAKRLNLDPGAERYAGDLGREDRWRL